MGACGELDAGVGICLDIRCTNAAHIARAPTRPTKMKISRFCFICDVNITG